MSRVLVRIGKAIDAALFDPDKSAKADFACSLLLLGALGIAVWLLVRML